MHTLIQFQFIERDGKHEQGKGYAIPLAHRR